MVRGHFALLMSDPDAHTHTAEYFPPLYLVLAVCCPPLNYTTSWHALYPLYVEKKHHIVHKSLPSRAVNLRYSQNCYFRPLLYTQGTKENLQLLLTYWKTPGRRSRASWRSQSPQWTVPGFSPCTGYQRTRRRMMMRRRKSGGNYAPIDKQKSWSHSWMDVSVG